MRKRKPKTRWGKPVAARHVLLARALRLVLWIQGLRYGASLEECIRYLDGEWCSRTVRRDLAVLVSLGILFPSKVKTKTVWKVNPYNQWKIGNDKDQNGKAEHRDNREVEPGQEADPGPGPGV